MAKFTPGAMTGAISGSLGSTVFSHNAGGPYMRLRAIPKNNKTIRQLLIRASVSALSQNWQLLAANAKASWNTWAQTNPVTNTLGSKTLLTGHQAYIACNLRLRIVGNTIATLAPAVSAPMPLLSLAVTAAAGISSCSIAFTASPLAAGIGAWFTAVLLDSPGINYIANRLKFLLNIGAAETSPVDAASKLQALFGTLVVGQKIVVEGYTFDVDSGLLSQPLRAECIVAA
jgi:hypothetical protein